jgi:dTDP-4-amino-4,6-dideoxygalactose transaminase
LALAILNNPPAFSEPVHVGYPLVEPGLKKLFYEHVDKMFERNWFTNDGPLVHKLEEEIARRHNVKHCIAVNNATLGLLLVLRAMELKGEVILPSFTFVATAHAVWWQGLTPVFCDIEPEGLMIDPARVEALISPDTCALIGVHLFGNLCKAGALESIAERNNLHLVFDAAHAFECSSGERMVGSFGDAEVLSFHATKFFSTTEGGAILTNDGQLAERLRLLRNFGFKDYDEVGFLGINAKMAEPSAAMGLASLPYLNDRRLRLAETLRLYIEKLQNLPGLKIVPLIAEGKSNYHYFVVLIDKDEFSIDRDTLYKVLWQENVMARRYFYPGCHRMEPYVSNLQIDKKQLKMTELICEQVICLPTNLNQPEQMTSVITDIIREAHHSAEEIKACVPARTIG